MFLALVRPQPAAETPGIVVAELHPGCHGQFNVVMAQGQTVVGDHPQAARHPQVNDQSALPELEQQIFGPSPDFQNSLSFHGLGKG